MRFFKKSAPDGVHEKGTPDSATPAQTPPRQNSNAVAADLQPAGRVPFVAIVLGAVASIGGFMFGYESGQISGFLAMDDFITRFGDNGQFSAVRQGTIVGLLAYVLISASSAMNTSNNSTVSVLCLAAYPLLPSLITLVVASQFLDLPSFTSLVSSSRSRAKKCGFSLRWVVSWPVSVLAPCQPWCQCTNPNPFPSASVVLPSLLTSF